MYTPLRGWGDAGACVCDGAVSPERPESFALPYLIIGMAALAAAAALAVTGVRIRGGTPYADMSETRRRARQNPAEIFERESRLAVPASGFMNLAFRRV